MLKGKVRDFFPSLLDSDLFFQRKGHFSLFPRSPIPYVPVFSCLARRGRGTPGSDEEVLVVQLHMGCSVTRAEDRRTVFHVYGYLRTWEKT